MLTNYLMRSLFLFALLLGIYFSLPLPFVVAIQDFPGGENQAQDWQPKFLSLPAAAFDMVIEDGAVSARPVSPPTWFELLGQPDVEKELELTVSQRAQLYEMQTWAGQAAIDSMKLLQNGQLSGEDYTLGLHTRAAEMEAQVTEMMLPHQITRLRQIVVQKHIARAGTFNAILSSDISERLSITEAQRKQLEKKAKEIEDRLKEQISKLRTDAREELLGVLTKEQRAELDSIIGSKYEPSDKDTIDMLMERSKSKLPREEN